MRDKQVEHLREGTVFQGRYCVVRSIKAGGMGAVYEVVDERTRARRALKVMLPATRDEPALRLRFEREAQLLGAVEGDHVVRIFDAGVDEATGIPFLVMELLRGQDLASAIEERGSLPFEEVVLLLSQVALALRVMHAAVVVHRDLKPENVFLTVREDGSPCIKVLDFGLAKSLAPAGASKTQAMGTPLFMAPEQMEGEISPRADLYALGQLAYVMLAGEPYWREEGDAATSLHAFVALVGRGSCEPASERAARRLSVALPAAFDGWFVKATARRARDRFDSATLSVLALAEAFGVEPPTTLLGYRGVGATRGERRAAELVPTRPVPGPRRRAQARERRAVLRVAAPLLVAALVASVALSASLRRAMVAALDILRQQEGASIPQTPDCADPARAHWNPDAPRSFETTRDTVHDATTDLIWERRPGKPLTLQGAIARCDALKLGGYTDWRLPKRIELESIVDYTRSDPAMDASTFTAVSSGFWTSSTSKAFPGRQIDVDFLSGRVDAGGIPQQEFQVRCVRNDPPSEDACPVRYALSRDGETVQDTATHLEWQRVIDPVAARTWSEAIETCAALEPSHGNRFRLPTVAELSTLVDEKAAAVVIDRRFFSGTPNQYFWTSTESLEIGKAWVVSFFSGAVNNFDKEVKRDGADRMLVRCVR